jgi:predicted nucleic acid-binding protein
MIFIDTGAFLARYVAADQFHHPATMLWADLEGRGERCVTSNFVLSETATLLGRRAGHQFAALRLRNIYASKAMEVWRPDCEDELRALKWFAKYSDQKVSFTDCVSFVLMKSGQVKEVFSFDRHFDLAGFRRMPTAIS